MITNITYSCGVCGEVYHEAKNALECETKVRIPRPCKQGDKIFVNPRYEARQLDTVVNCTEYKHGWLIETEHAWQYTKDGFDRKTFYLDTLNETKQLTEIN